MQRPSRGGGGWPVFSDDAASPPIASPSAARSPFHHGGSLHNLGSHYRRDFSSGYSVPPPPESTVSAFDYASGGGCGFYLSPPMSLPFQLQSMNLEDDAIFSGGLFPTMLQRRRPTTGVFPLRPQLSLRLRDLRGKILMLSMDRQGSLHLQKIIEQRVDDKEDIDICLSETINHIGCLMVNKFASYVMQKLVQVCNPQQVTRILTEITRHNQVLEICFSKYGVGVMQKLVKNITAREQVSLLISVLVPDVVTLVNDTNGHHLVEMCLETFTSMETAVLYRKIIDNCYRIATDKCGCRVLQDIIKSAETPFRLILMNTISRHSLALTKHLYGNYVVQFLLDLRIPEITAVVIMQLRGHFAALSCNKYGSHVVEKCMKLSETEDFAEIIVELMQKNQQQHHLLVLDQYGNYIVTCAFSLAKERRLEVVYSLLVGHIEKHYEEMRGHFYGKKALKRLEKQNGWVTDRIDEMYCSLMPFRF